MAAKRIQELGAGFAGLWSALVAARQLDQLGIAPEAIEVLLVNRDAFHAIRVGNYKSDLSPLRVPLEAVLSTTGVRWLVAEVGPIDMASRTVTVLPESGPQILACDRLVFALGSQRLRPQVPGLAQPRRVVLVDHNPTAGSDMGDEARPVIEQALAALGVELCLGVRVDGLDGASIRFDSGEVIATQKVVWCAGMRASPLTASCGVATDGLGRWPVDAVLRVQGLRDVFAAGDSANLALDDGHSSVKSCQHGRPMGRFAGHNAVCDLPGRPPVPRRIDWHTTILDPGPWGALYTEGWDRQVVATGETDKRTKRLINGERFFPPLTGDRGGILAAAAAVIERPPPLQPQGSQP